MKKGWIIGLAVGIPVFIALCIGVYFITYKIAQKSFGDVAQTLTEDENKSGKKNGKTKKNEDTVSEEYDFIPRPVFLSASEDSPAFVPSVQSYHTDTDLSNIDNRDQVYLQDEQIRKLAENNFVVMQGGGSEFFDVYEMNRYFQFPNFVTTDSMMHTYHLYFAMLQKKTEKQYLADLIEEMTFALLNESRDQYEELKGTEWEDAAIRNYAFFTVAANLIDPSAGIDDPVKDLAGAELDLIEEEAGIDYSPLFNNDYEDYTQYTPRGYYEGDEQLERYFRTMMWYGRRNFAQKDEDQDRSALLMTLALDEAGYEQWQAVYTVTSFFAGASDDCGYYEYLPLICSVYGDDVVVSDLIGDEDAFEKYHALTGRMEPPKINSVPFDDDGGKTDKTEQAMGFRLMGQRFSLDEAIFTQLTYSKVDENAAGDQRLLPDALDVPAALGSEMAYRIISEEGMADYPNYDEQLSRAREEIKRMPELWTGSLYASWMYTLNPLLEEKGEGYPSFMTNDEWTKKSLETYLGSWTELKHDTILYSKQMMAEMGGGDEEILDDRGYVEPEPILYDRLRVLTENTASGLKEYGLLDRQDEEDLQKLAKLSDSLCRISVKELQNEALTDDEYELIRSYGGDLEHFWNETVKATTGEDYNCADEFPAALVADVATDPNGSILEEAIGSLNEIYVVVPVDGSLRIASGVVYNYYQFEQPMAEGRLTDSKWRQMCGLETDEEYNYMGVDLDDKKPAWTKSYRQYYEYNN